MWSRALLKKRGEAAFKANYWRCVLVALVFSIVARGGTQGSFLEGAFSEVPSYYNEVEIVTFSIIMVIIAVVVALVIVAFSFAIGAFLFWPLEVGCCKFFLNNSDAKCEDLGLIAFAFDNKYGNIAKVQFFRYLYISLWSMLLIVPGIIKAYEYYLVPYLLAENPGMDTKTALETSKRLMYGHKMETFVLHLSFIGWMILTGLTMGLLGIFYVNPYIRATEAELYKVLSGKASGMPDGVPMFYTNTANNESIYQSPEKADQNNAEDVMVNFEEPVEQTIAANNNDQKHDDGITSEEL